jgi:hypothetical protein
MGDKPCDADNLSESYGDAGPVDLFAAHEIVRVPALGPGDGFIQFETDAIRVG